MSFHSTNDSSSSHHEPYEVDECRGVLRVYSDGSIVRSSKPSFNVPINDDGSVIWKDVVFDKVNHLSLRLYKPAAAQSGSKLPVFFYIHGGGFCIGSRTWPNCQNYCLRLASDLQAVIVAPDYRLAPENRLPAAIEDGYTAVKWLQGEAESVYEPDKWMCDVADFGNVFICGDSAGGNIGHHLAIRLGKESAELGRVRVKGYVLLAPFFGGTVRCKSEAEGPKDAFLNLDLIDSSSLEKVELDPILVVVGGSDLLQDRAKDYAMKLQNWGKKIEYIEFEGQQHGFFTINPNSQPSNHLMSIIKGFIAQNST
ncbi:hypothetical protein F8388_012131 [Cannabis sativa]|uniref:Alpha/beta hydrolase fold-3 domain-containing protein n=1 Tax=Cannabis sativa TaxID=3483 RepID=A0A7J6GGK4_CANSA|nr:hypothetical protein G4B88_020522 [Cannabis sativa]KAF4381209.1 hypothetical protein F8388_012131 [Cannabis sativa]